LRVKAYRVEKDIDKGLYGPERRKRQAFFGLPDKVRFCKKCVYSNQVPGSSIEFEHKSESKKTTVRIGKDGVCDACRYTAEKGKIINWDEREKELKELCDRYRSRDGSYDCLVPGSGGKDSFYAAHILKYKYGMHPLTVTWAPHIHTEWGRKNFNAWINAGFDNYLFTPNGRVHRLLTRLAVENLLHPFQPFIIGQKAFAPKLALLCRIPLVFYGENDAEYNNPIADNASAQRDWKYFTVEDPSKVYLGGVSIADIKAHFGVSENDLLPYMPADPNRIEKLGMQVHYLGYYLKWHPQKNYYYAAEHGGFQASPERTPGTYSKYNSIDDKIDDLHYYTTYMKFGIGRATYDAAQEIRSGDITRSEGISLVKKYDGEFPERFIGELLKYLSIGPEEFPGAAQMFEEPVMDLDYFNHLVNRFRSPHLWEHSSGVWSLRHAVWNEVKSEKEGASDAYEWAGNAYGPEA